jgi:hypothetical protein
MFDGTRGRGNPRRPPWATTKPCTPISTSSGSGLIPIQFILLEVPVSLSLETWFAETFSHNLALWIGTSVHQGGIA